MWVLVYNKPVDKLAEGGRNIQQLLVASTKNEQEMANLSRRKDAGSGRRPSSRIFCASIFHVPGLCESVTWTIVDLRLCLCARERVNSPLKAGCGPYGGKKFTAKIKVTLFGARYSKFAVRN